MSKALPMVLSALLFALATWGALHELKRLDSLESHHVNSVRGASWQPFSTREKTLPLGGFRVPAGGSARVSVCAHGALHGSLRVEHNTHIHTEPLTLDAARSGPRRSCYSARWRGDSTRSASVSLSLTARSPAANLERLDASAGAVISPWSLWPMALMLLAVGLFVLAPRPLHEPLAPWLNARPSRVLAICALVLAQVIGQIPTALMGFGSFAFFYGLLAQHGSMVLMSAALLGALNPRRPVPLPFGLISRDKLIRAMIGALGVLVIALSAGYLIHDAADTPLGQVIERVPLRYVIAFGALLAPLPEELFFRGALLDAFSRRGEIFGVWIAALIFTGMHAPQLWGSPVGLVPIALVGVVNGYLRVHTRSLTAPWLLHSVYNAALASSVLLDS